MKKVIFLLIFTTILLSSSGCVTVTKIRSSDERHSQQYNEYGLRKIPERRMSAGYNNFARSDVVQNIMASRHFFGEVKVVNAFLRTMPRDIFILPYLESTLEIYAKRSSCFVSLVTDYANAKDPDGKNPASIKGMAKINRFGRYLNKNSLMYLPNKRANFLYSHPKLGWQLTCFEPLNAGKQLRRIIPSGQRVMSSAEIVQIMLLDHRILRGKNVVSSDQSEGNRVIVSRAKNGRISILLRNFTMSGDVIALGIKHDKTRRMKRKWRR